MAFTEEQLKGIAAQLRCPEGEFGTQVAANMNSSNAAMINSTLFHMRLQNNQKVLELGPGNARHMLSVLQDKPQLQYSALDISTDMVKEASNLCEGLPARFYHYDGTAVPENLKGFDKIFTVNTIYFWEQPEKLLQNLKNSLTEKGLIYITFADGDFMKSQLPFTKYGFNFYALADVVALLTRSGFKVVNHVEDRDVVTSKAGDEVQRTYYILIAENQIN